MKSARLWVRMAAAFAVWGEVAATALAYTATVDGVEWRYSVSGNSATVTGAYPVEGTLIIPDTLRGYPVTGIRWSAFNGCSGLTSVSIPDSVTSIGNDAFNGCSSLTSVSIGDSVTSIGSDAFSGCASALFDTNSIPGVCLVDGWAVGSQFPSGDLDLTGIRGIGSYAFSSCSGLTSVDIPSSVTSIGYSAFSRCSGLKSVTIPDSVTLIEGSAFYSCSGLTSVDIPPRVTSIEPYTFCGCSGLTRVTIPDSVTSIGRYAFDECALSLYNTKRIPGVCLVDGWAVGNQSPSGDLDLTGVRGIGDSAFEACSSLTSVTIPDSVTSLGKRAFFDCSALTIVTILGNVTNNWSFDTVNYYPFYNCTSLTTIVFGKKMTTIGSGMFNGCSGLTSVTIPDSVTSIGAYAFHGCASALYDTNSIPGVRLVDGWAVGNQSPSGDLYLTGIRGIGDAAFWDCDGLKSVTIPDSVTRIGADAFRDCSGLKSVTIPDSVTSIEGSAFYKCNGLTSVTIPQCVCERRLSEVFPDAYQHIANIVIGEKVTEVGVRAFSNCRGLKSVTIPDSVTRIGAYAFDGCASALYDTNSIPGVRLVDGWAVGGNQSPSGDLYLTGIRGIGDNAFSSCNGLKSVTFQGNVKNEWEASSAPFRGCTNLATLVLGEKMTKIGAYMFSGCSGLKSVTITDSVTSIGDSAFSGCSGLTSVTIPQYVCERRLSEVFPDAYQRIANIVIGGTVTKIGAQAFSDCIGLTSVTIGDSVTNIGPCAFSNCYNLKGMVIPDSVKTIGIGAFENCKGLGAFSLGKGVESIAEGVATLYSCHTAFGNAYTLTAFHVDPENPHFKSVNGVIYTKDGKELVAFPAGCRGEFAVPNGVEKIWAGAFCGAFDLNLVIIPDSVLDIGGGVFSGCSSLKNIYLPARFKGNENVYFAGSAYGHTFTYERPIERELALDGQDGISEAMTIHPVYCEAMPAISIPTRNGYRFGGYFSESDGGGVQYYTATGESCRTWDSLSVTTLYALWVELPPVEVPVITPGDGAIFSGETCEVSISCATEGAAIYFSTNGSTPRLIEASRYSGPFAISDSTVVKAVAELDGVKSEYATASIRRMALTLAEAAGAPRLPFATGGTADWMPVGDATAESGLAAQGGGIGANSETWMETTVSGAGTFSFAWKVDCEKDDSGEATWDHLAVVVDGTERGRIDGTTEWATVTLALEGAGTHTVRWSFAKDDYDEGKCRDLAWVSGVQWVPEVPADVFPEAVDDTEVFKALSEVADARLAEKIGSVAEYEAFRAWIAEKGLEPQAVKESAHAWPSYAMGAAVLFENEPGITLGGVSVETGGEGQRDASGTIMKVSVTVKDGEQVVEVDAAKVAALFECTSDLADWTGEAALTPTVEGKSAEGGALNFEVLPGDGTAKRAFLRIAE